MSGASRVSCNTRPTYDSLIFSAAAISGMVAWVSTAAVAGHRRGDPGWTAAGAGDAGGVDAAVRRGVDGAAQDGFLLEDATSGTG